MMQRGLATFGTLALLAATSAFAQNVDQDMDDDGQAGGCVSNRQVYAEGAELCQEGTLVRCNAGAWGAIGVCQEKPGPAPVSQGGDVVEESDD
jgi:hypothetical protein